MEMILVREQIFFVLFHHSPMMEQDKKCCSVTGPMGCKTTLAPRRRGSFLCPLTAATLAGAESNDYELWPRCYVPGWKLQTDALHGFDVGSLRRDAKHRWIATEKDVPLLIRVQLKRSQGNAIGLAYFVDRAYRSFNASLWMGGELVRPSQALNARYKYRVVKTSLLWNSLPLGTYTLHLVSRDLPGVGIVGVSFSA